MTDQIHNFINAADAQSPLDIVPVAGRIGAEVRGIALSGDLEPAVITALQTALARHKVLFFREQHELTDERHEQFAAVLGDPVAHPTVPVAEGSRYLLELDSKEGYAASSWHTDVTFVEAYPKASILRAINVPAAGGDTLWANGATAYEELPEALKTLVDGLWAVHSNKYDYAHALGTKDAARAEEYSKIIASTVYETEHPVVRVHPETGERSLLVGHFVKQFVGFNTADSQRLFSILQDHNTRPEITGRWRWVAGEVAIWDNRATQHRAIADFGLQRRTLRRATVAGDIPVAIDGRRSRTVKKEQAPILTPAE